MAGGPPPSAPQNGAPSTTTAPRPIAATATAARMFWPSRTNRSDTAMHSRIVAVANRANVVLPMP